MKNLNEEQKAALSALLEEYEKRLQMMPPVLLENGELSECVGLLHYMQGEVQYISYAVFDAAEKALQGAEAERAELARRIDRLHGDWKKVQSEFFGFSWEWQEAKKKQNTDRPIAIPPYDPQSALHRFRVDMEEDRDFLRGLLEGVDESEPKKDDEPKKEGKKEKRSFPANPDAFVVLKEAARRKETPKYAKMKNPDIIFSLITDGKPAYRYTIMEGHADISGEKIAEYARRNDWGKERMRDDVQRAIRLWSQYLSAYLRYLESHKV